MDFLHDTKLPKMLPSIRMWQLQQLATCPNKFVYTHRNESTFAYKKGRRINYKKGDNEFLVLCSANFHVNQLCTLLCLYCGGKGAPAVKGMEFSIHQKCWDKVKWKSLQANFDVKIQNWELFTRIETVLTCDSAKRKVLLILVLKWLQCQFDNATRGRYVRQRKLNGLADISQWKKSDQSFSLEFTFGTKEIEKYRLQQLEYVKYQIRLMDVYKVDKQHDIVVDANIQEKMIPYDDDEDTIMKDMIAEDTKFDSYILGDEVKEFLEKRKAKETEEKRQEKAENRKHDMIVMLNRQEAIQMIPYYPAEDRIMMDLLDVFILGGEVYEHFQAREQNHNSVIEALRQEAGCGAPYNSDEDILVTERDFVDRWDYTKSINMSANVSANLSTSANLSANQLGSQTD